MSYRWIAGFCLGALSLLAAFGTSAQTHPSHATRIVVGFGPASSADILARLLARQMEQKLNQPVVVENRPGNSSMLAADAVARSSPDGYTLFMATVANTLNPAQTESGFDLARDMAPVALLGVVSNVLAVHPSVPATNLGELVALARTTPDSLAFGTSGAGTASHLEAELFNTPHVAAGSLRAIAVAQPRRAGIMPEVPTMDEAGMPGFDAGIWIGLLAPARTPADIVDRLSASANEALRSDLVQVALKQQGIDSIGGGAAEFSRFIRADIEKWASVLTAAGLKKQ